MLKVGITGGIGAGKSTVCRVFETLGIPVFYADDAAKFLMNSDAGLRQQIVQTFGEKTYENNKLNRTYLAQQVFGNPEKLAQLNALTHPAVIRYGEAWMKQQQTPYVLKEAALFFESGSYKSMNLMIGVSAPQPLRILRTMQREHISEAQVLERISKQMDDTEKMRRCDYIIVNDDAHSVIVQVWNLHQELLLKANS
ncbi:MAG TPA: dephospho-CoA kinase [Chitinophagaceae bacterium]|nr:dephospho-CoA kinase [Chitinophagaceae bacterium]